MRDIALSSDTIARAQRTGFRYKENRYHILPVFTVVNIKNKNVDWRKTLNNIYELKKN